MSKNERKECQGVEAADSKGGKDRVTRERPSGASAVHNHVTNYGLELAKPCILRTLLYPHDSFVLQCFLTEDEPLFGMKLFRMLCKSFYMGKLLYCRCVEFLNAVLSEPTN